MKAILIAILRFSVVLACAITHDTYADDKASTLLPLNPAQPAAASAHVPKAEADAVLHPPAGQPASTPSPVASAPAPEGTSPATSTPPKAAAPAATSPPPASGSAAATPVPAKSDAPAVVAPKSAPALAAKDPGTASIATLSSAPADKATSTPAASLSTAAASPPTPAGTVKRSPAEEPKKNVAASPLMPLPEAPPALVAPKGLLPSPPALTANSLTQSPQLLPSVDLNREHRPASGIPPAPSGPEVAIILAENRFYPSMLRLREGQPIKLIFTSVNPRPAALIFEGLGLQRWLRQDSPPSTTEEARAHWEVTREIASDRLTEIPLELKPGTYSFHDALSGATGEIIVE